MIVPQEILSAVDENAMSSRRQISMRTKRQESIFNQKNILSLKENISHDNVVNWDIHKHQPRTPDLRKTLLPGSDQSARIIQKSLLYKLI